MFVTMNVGSKAKVRDWLLAWPTIQGSSMRPQLRTEYKKFNNTFGRIDDNTGRCQNPHFHATEPVNRLL